MTFMSTGYMCHGYDLATECDFGINRRRRRLTRNIRMCVCVCVCVCVSVFRQGDVGTNWYAVLSGSLDMNVSETGDSKVHQQHIPIQSSVHRV